jgi:large subunit ribosomal protein L24
MRLTQCLLKRSNQVGELTKLYSNLPEAYIKRSMEKVEWRTPRGLPQYQVRDVGRKNWHFGLDPPWTGGFARQNERRHPKVFLEPIAEWSVFKGDRVEVLRGPDKGKQGLVSKVIQERNWVIVEGLNCKLKTMGKTSTFPGTVIKVEQPLLVTSDISLVDPSDLKGTPIEWRFTEEGDRVRVSVRTGRVIPIPKRAEVTHDYKSKNTYKESEKDTTSDDVTKITFTPKLKTFEMDIMEARGIEENRTPAKTYWY